jgi:hypothetical protein
MFLLYIISAIYYFSPILSIILIKFGFIKTLDVAQWSARICIRQRFPNFYTLRPPQDFALIYAPPPKRVIRLFNAATLLGMVDKQKESLRQSFVITQCLQKLSTKLNLKKKNNKKRHSV